MDKRNATRTLKSLLFFLVAFGWSAASSAQPSNLLRPWPDSNTPWSYITEIQMNQLVTDGFVSKLGASTYAVLNPHDPVERRRWAIYCSTSITVLDKGTSTTSWGFQFRYIEFVYDVAAAEREKFRTELEASRAALEARTREASALQQQAHTTADAYAALAERFNQQTALEPWKAREARIQSGLVGAGGGISLTLLVVVLLSLFRGGSGPRPRPSAHQCARCVPASNPVPAAGPRAVEPPSERTPETQAAERIKHLEKQVAEATSVVEAIAAEDELLASAFHNYINHVARRPVPRRVA